MTSRDPRRDFLKALAAELRLRPLASRRVLRELAHHLDDAVADLRASGLSPEDALEEALRRLGQASTIADGFRPTARRPERRRSARALRSPAWLAVAAMSLVTAWAAELPQASGAAIPASRPALHRAHAARIGPVTQTAGAPRVAHRHRRHHHRV